MNAMPRLRALEPSLGEAVVEDFIRDGAHQFDQPLDVDACADMLAALKSTREFGASLFLSEEEFDADPQYTGVNPRPGRNLLERFEARLGFVEKAPQEKVDALRTRSAELTDQIGTLNKNLEALG